MRSILPLIAFLIAGISCHAQFESKLTIALPDTLTYVSLEWVDADNDSLMDVMVVAKGDHEMHSLLFYKNEEANDFSFASFIKMEVQEFTFHLADVDRDNQMDILVSGIKGAAGFTSALLNKGDFQFEWISTPMLPKAVSSLQMADLDQDGIKELIVSGDDNGPYLEMYKQKGNTWELVNDTIKVNAQEIILADFDGDMDSDIFISGIQNGSFYLAILFNRGGFWFADPVVAGNFTNVISTVADINYDGLFDVLMVGDDAQGNYVTRFLISAGSGSFVQQDTTLIADKARSLFAADLSSDGAIDIHFFGDSENAVVLANGDKLLLPANDVLMHKFGDQDRDGDLDVIQLTPGSVVVLENVATDINLPPGKPSDPIAAMIYNRLFIYWNKPGDDHTPFKSITYDLTLQAAQEEWMVGDFDLFHFNRMVVSFGNLGLNNFALLKHVPVGQHNFYIQAIDNSFYASAKSICTGTVSSCSDMTWESIQRCGQEEVSLTAGQQALWFSFADGYLGIADSYAYTSASTDTIFAVIPGNSACAAIKVFVITQQDELVKTESTKRFVCNNAQLVLSAEPGWAEIQWSSSQLGFLSDESSIHFTVSAADTVRVTLSDGAGCQIQREVILTISELDLQIPSDTYQIVKGESVQLKAEGTGQFSWSPATSLNNAAVSNPVATPASTTEYTVTLTDSIGCLAQGKVLVIVEQTAFIPNLFTPNEDGKNDALKIYGLGVIQNFSFSVYNREGSVVFKTNDVNEITITGWDGTSKGTVQPPGVYHWKVQGEHAGGGRLLLNGKDTGSVVLVR